MKIIAYITIFFLYFPVIAAPWTWLYHKKFDFEQDHKSKKRTPEIYFSKELLPHTFTQLIFSWNAFRPSKGHYSFWVKVRDAKNNRWSKWHRMAEWGAHKQRSYLTNSDKTARFVHVRLEAEPSVVFDGFSIKIVAHGKAPIEEVKACSVCVSDFTQFKSESAQAIAQAKLQSCAVSGIALISQFELDHPRKEEICSPTSCSMLLNFLTQQTIDPIACAQSSFDIGLDKYGSWPFNVAHAFDYCKGAHYFAVARLPSFIQLHHYVSRGVPVVVSVRGNLPGAPKSYDFGHLVLVVGYDARSNEIICHDPAVYLPSKRPIRYKLSHFLKAWERSHRLSYLTVS